MTNQARQLLTLLEHSNNIAIVMSEEALYGVETIDVVISDTAIEFNEQCYKIGDITFSTFREIKPYLTKVSYRYSGYYYVYKDQAMFPEEEKKIEEDLEEDY